MKTKIWGLAVLLCAGLSLQAAYTGTASLQSGGKLSSDIGPYTGTLAYNSNNYNPINLYCDDAQDTIPVPQPSYNVKVISLNGSDNTALAGSSALTRFGNGTPEVSTGSSYFSGTAFATSLPTGTALYDDLAWLFTQLSAASSAGNTTQAEGIQTAAWDLTSLSTRVTAVSGNDETDANAWLHLLGTLTTAQLQGGAGSSGTLNGINWSAANFANWVVVTDTSAARQATGGGTACNSGTGCQEFLAYVGGGNLQTGNVGAAPEPATFGLFGSALLFGALVARRRRGSK